MFWDLWNFTFAKLYITTSNVVVSLQLNLPPLPMIWTVLLPAIKYLLVTNESVLLAPSGKLHNLVFKYNPLFSQLLNVTNWFKHESWITLAILISGLLWISNSWVVLSGHPYSDTNFSFTMYLPGVFCL